MSSTTILGFGRFVGALQDFGFFAPRPGGRSTLSWRWLLKAIKRLAKRQDGVGRAVVVFQPHDFGLGPILLEAQDVGHVGAAPAVNRLIVVAHHAQVAMPGGQRLDDAVLAAVGVLVLVDQQVGEAAGFGPANVGETLEQLFGAQQQIVEIDRLQRP